MIKLAFRNFLVISTFSYLFENYGKRLKSLYLITSLLRNVFSLPTFSSFIFEILFSTTKSLLQIISKRSPLRFGFGSIQLVRRFRKSLISLTCRISGVNRSLIFVVIGRFRFSRFTRKTAEKLANFLALR